MKIEKSYNNVTSVTTTWEKWKQCEKRGNNVREALQKCERNNVALKEQCANYKQEKDHNAKPTIEKHNQQ